MRGSRIKSYCSANIWSPKTGPESTGQKPVPGFSEKRVLGEHFRAILLTLIHFDLLFCIERASRTLVFEGFEDLR